MARSDEMMVILGVRLDFLFVSMTSSIFSSVTSPKFENIDGFLCISLDSATPSVADRSPILLNGMFLCLWYAFYACNMQFISEQSFAM